MITPAELRTELNELDRSSSDALAALEAIGDRIKEEIDELEVDEIELESLWARYTEIEMEIRGEQLLRAPDPLAAALEAQRPDIIARIGTDAALACALEQTAAHVALPYYTTKTGWIYALVTLATTDVRRVRVVTELGAHLQHLVEARLAGGVLVNAVALAACARALLLLRPVEAIAPLEATLQFCVHPECHHEAVATGGAVALALAAADARASIPVLRAYVERWKRVHPGARYVMEACYALWLLTEDASAPRAYLDDATHTKGNAFAAAALADLHATAAIPSIEARLGTLANPVTREAFAEALSRLRTQTARPAIVDRMILMFGLRTPSEQALGADSDDVFVQRVRAARGDAALGRVTETDDAGDED